MKQSHYFIIVLIASIVCISSSVGRNDRRAGAPGDGSCNACHSGGSTNGATALQGLPNAYVAGEEYDLILAVQDGSMRRAGFQIVATDGTSGEMVGEFTPGNNSRLTTGAHAGRLTHSSPLNETNNIVEFNFKWTAPSVLESPESIVFYYNIVAANANGGTSGDGVYQVSTDNMVLPIHLASFEVVQDGRHVALSWSVLEAAMDSKFEIQRSRDAVEGEYISVVHAGQGSSDFSYIDTDPLYNVDSYYRLRMVDEDGLVTYSRWESIHASVDRPTNRHIYPNPASIGQPVNVMYTADQDQDVDIIVYDLQGNQVGTLNDRYQLQKGDNSLIIKDLGIFESGVYIVQVRNVDTKEVLSTQRLFVQEGR